MRISQALLPEFDNEMAITRKVLERAPADKFDWQPHPKSMTLGRLTQHVAEIPGWAVLTISRSEFDLAPPISTKQEILGAFEKNVREARAAIEGASDEHLMQTWSLLKGGEVVFSMPRMGILRSMVMNHLIHHRAQLGVYLRLNDVPVPSIYGPSADEGQM